MMRAVRDVRDGMPGAREELTAQLERLDVARLEWRASALDRIARHARAEAAAEAATREAVGEARGLGATWQQIGDAAGITRQSAWKRWASPADPEPAP